MRILTFFLFLLLTSCSGNKVISSKPLGNTEANMQATLCYKCIKGGCHNTLVDGFLKATEISCKMAMATVPKDTIITNSINVSGQVVGKDGKPYPNALAKVYLPNGSELQANSDANGFYSITIPPSNMGSDISDQIIMDTAIVAPESKKGSTASFAIVFITTKK